MNLKYLFPTLLVLLCTTLTTPAFSQTTNISVLNNTLQPLEVVAGDTVHTIAPYAKKELLRVERNTGFKPGEVTTFDLDWQHWDLHYQMQRTGEWIGSSIASSVRLADEPDQPIFEQENFAQLPLVGDDASASFYGASTKSIAKIYADVSLGIDGPHPRYHRQPEANHLTVLTLNTQLMPLYAGTYNKLNNPGHRAKVIPSLVKDYDVVMMQELYDRDYRATVTALMAEDYPYHTKVIGDGTMNLLTGGVMIFSHWPIDQVQTTKYTACDGIDCLADQGGQLARVTKQGKSYYILATHTQSEASVAATTARQEQLSQLRVMLDGADVPTDAPVIMAGDLNVDAYTDEEAALSAKFPHAPYHPAGLKYTYDTELNSMVVEDNRQLLDYMLVLDGWQAPKQNQTRVRVMRKLADPVMWPDVDLSDHFGVEGDFVFS